MRLIARMIRAVLAPLVFAAMANSAALAAAPDDLSLHAQAALEQLYRTNPTAKAFARDARAVLVFPRVIKAGLMARPYSDFSGSYADGALIKNGRIVSYYHSVSSRWARRNGDKPFAYVVFLMSDEAENYLGRVGSWKLGTGPSSTIVDKDLSNTRAISSVSNEDAYIFAFDRAGSVDVLPLEGSRITRIGR